MGGSVPSCPKAYIIAFSLLVGASGLLANNVPSLQDQIVALQGGDVRTDEHGLMLPPSAEAAAWLRVFWKTGRKLPAWNSSSEGLREDVAPPAVSQQHDDTVWGNMLARAANPQLQSDEGLTCTHANHEDQIRRSSSPSPESLRTNLLVVPVGDEWKAERWLTHPQAATFDIVAIHHGDDPNFTCPECRLVTKIKGPKWRLYYLFTATSEWEALAKCYDYVMLPDDDLDMDTCTINKVFRIMREYDLLLAQPSVCEMLGSAGTWRPDLHQRPQWLLRYSTFVEVMAPAFRMDFFHDVVRGTFSKYWTYVGWGLDSIWPALLHYPKDRIAIVDAACMVHKPTEGGLGNAGKAHSVYAPGLSPYTPKQEEMIVFSAFNYSGATTEALGEPFMSFRIVGGSPNVKVLKAMAETAGRSWSGGAIEGNHRMDLLKDAVALEREQMMWHGARAPTTRAYEDEDDESEESYMESLQGALELLGGKAKTQRVWNVLGMVAVTGLVCWVAVRWGQRARARRRAGYNYNGLQGNGILPEKCAAMNSMGGAKSLRRKNEQQCQFEGRASPAHLGLPL